jgi:hypothetical protein
MKLTMKACKPHKAACELGEQYRMQRFDVLRIILKYNRFEGVAYLFTQV